MVGIDIGKGYIKFYSPDKQAVYPSLISYGVVGTIDGRGDGSIKYKGKDFIVGQDAELGTMAWSIDDKKGTRGSLVHILHIASGYFPEKDTIICGVGLPVGNYESEKNKLKEILQGTHTFQVDGKEKKVTIIPYVMPEGIGAYCSIMLNDKGEFRSDITPALTLVVDIGFKTLDTVLVDGAKVSMKGWKSTFTAVEGVTNRLEAKLMETHGVIMPEEKVRLKKVLMTPSKIFMMRGEAVDVTTMLMNATQDAGSEIIDYVVHTLRETAAEKILFSGGGSILFREQLKSSFPYADFMDDIHANAKGFYKLALRAHNAKYKGGEHND